MSANSVIFSTTEVLLVERVTFYDELKVDADKAAVGIKLALRKLIASKKEVPALATGKKEAGIFKLSAKELKAKKPVVKKRPRLRSQLPKK